jgi:Asp/Glu/hydantoin racemase
MRGRKPNAPAIAPADLPVLRRIARSRRLPVFQVVRANILLALAAGDRVAVIAAQARCDASTVWRTCRRYERAGMISVTSPETPRRL